MIPGRAPVPIPGVKEAIRERSGEKVESWNMSGASTTEVPAIGRNQGCKREPLRNRHQRCVHQLQERLAVSNSEQRRRSA